MNTPIRPITRQARLVHAAIFIVGAILLQILIGADGAPLAFYWLPGMIGAIYCVAALSGGRGGSFWATGLVLLGWGATVVWLMEVKPDVEGSGAYAFGMGLGVTLAAIAARAGYKVDFLAAGVTALAVGAVFMLSGRVDAFADASTFALLLAIVAIANAVFAAFPTPTAAPASVDA